MSSEIDNILQFCAYYQINKYASNLKIHLSQQNIQKPLQEQKKVQKVYRKKIQVVQIKKPEKQTKRKVQVVTKKNQKQPKFYQTQQKRTETKNLDYFINHINGFYDESNPKSYENYKQNSYKSRDLWYDNPNKNYEGFQKGHKKFQYQTFQSQMSRQNGMNYKGNGNIIHNSYQLKNRQLNSKKSQNQLPHQTQSSKIKQFWQNTIYDHRKNKLGLQNIMYSPIKRQSFSPLQNSIISDVHQQKSLSRSRSQLKKKNSERPLYNPTHLSLKDLQNERKFGKSAYEQSSTPNSFILENRISSKKGLEDEESRQVSTVYISKNIKDKSQLTRQSEIELDDKIGQNISGFVHELRNPMTKIPVKGKTSKI